jgi:hypothetical protein
VAELSGKRWIAGVEVAASAWSQESNENASRAVFHVDDDEVVAGETGDLGEGRGEAEEEKTVQGLTITEARFEAFRVGGGGGSDCVCHRFFFCFSSRSDYGWVCHFVFSTPLLLLFCFFFCFAFSLCGLNTST